MIINPLKTGTVDIILNSLLESEEALAGYQVHPEHINLGTNYANHRFLPPIYFLFFIIIILYLNKKYLKFFIF